MAYIFPLSSKPDKTGNFSGILQVAADIGQLLLWPSDTHCISVTLSIQIDDIIPNKLCTSKRYSDLQIPVWNMPESYCILNQFKTYINFPSEFNFPNWKTVLARLNWSIVLAE